MCLLLLCFRGHPESAVWQRDRDWSYFFGICNKKGTMEYNGHWLKNWLNILDEVFADMLFGSEHKSSFFLICELLTNRSCLHPTFLILPRFISEGSQAFAAISSSRGYQCESFFPSPGSNLCKFPIFLKWYSFLIQPVPHHLPSGFLSLAAPSLLCMPCPTSHFLSPVYSPGLQTGFSWQHTGWRGYLLPWESCHFGMKNFVYC